MEQKMTQQRKLELL